MATSNQEGSETDKAKDIACSSDFSDSVTQGIPSSKQDLRRSILQGSDAESRILVSTGSSIKTKLYCDLCKQEKEIVPAEGFCVDCNEYLCTSCFNFHKKQKNLNHLLKDKSSMPQDKEARNTNDVCTDKCTIHVDKIIEYFCQSCDQLGCSACFVTGHRTCKNVDFIPEIISDKEIDEVCKQVNKIVQHMSDKLFLHKNRVAYNRVRNNDLQKKAKDTIVKQRQEVESIFDRMEKDMYASVDEIYNDNESNITEVSELVNSLTTEVSHMHSDLESKSRNRCQLFIASKFAEKRMKAIENDVEKLKKSNKLQNFQYDPSNQLLHELANIEIGKVNRINSNPFKYIDSYRDISIAEKLDEENVINKHDMYTCGHYFTGICLIGKCRIVAIDKSTCKLVDLQTEQTISYVEFDDDAFDVTNLSENEVAVTFPYKGEIKFMMVSDNGSLSEHRTINVGKGCSGIHYFNEKVVVAFKKCMEGKPRIEIMDLEGHISNSIEKDEYGRRIIASPLYVTASPDFSIIYVTDRLNGILISMALDGKINYKCALTYPSGVTVDEYGSVFVCCVSGKGNIDSSIMQLSEDFESVQFLMKRTNVVFYINAIAYCKEDHSFYITNQEIPSISVVKTKNV